MDVSIRPEDGCRLPVPCATVPAGMQAARLDVLHSNCLTVQLTLQMSAWPAAHGCCADAPWRVASGAQTAEGYIAYMPNSHRIATAGVLACNRLV